MELMGSIYKTFTSEFGSVILSNASAMISMSEAITALDPSSNCGRENGFM